MDRRSNAAGVPPRAARVQRRARPAALQAGEPVELEGIRVALDGSGIRAFIGDREVASHEAFWFAWSQFRPETAIWQRGAVAQG